MTSLMENFEEWAHLRHHPATAGTPAPTATIEPAPQEEPVNLLELENDAKALVAKFGQIDADATEKAAAIKATPEGALLFEAVHALAAAEVPPADLQTAGEIIKLIAARSTPAPAPAPEPAQPSFTPAGPQIGGQA